MGIFFLMEFAMVIYHPKYNPRKVKKVHFLAKEQNR